MQPIQQSTQNDIFDVLHTNSTRTQISKKFQLELLQNLSTLNELKEEWIFEPIRSRDRRKREPRRKRQYFLSSKWNQTDVLNYWKFYVQFSISKPYLQFSWYRWKVDSIFKLMAFAVNKTPGQCKSFDERMKKESALKYSGQKDILDVALLKLKKASVQGNQILSLVLLYEQTQQEKSPHMQMLDESLERVTKTQQSVQSLFNQICPEPKNSSYGYSDLLFDRNEYFNAKGNFKAFQLE